MRIDTSKAIRTRLTATLVTTVFFIALIGLAGIFCTWRTSAGYMSAGSSVLFLCIMTAVMVLFSVFLATFTVKRISAPFEQLQEAVDDMMNGRFDRRPEGNLQDEASALSRDLNALADIIKQSRGETTAAGSKEQSYIAALAEIESHINKYVLGDFATPVHIDEKNNHSVYSALEKLRQTCKGAHDDITAFAASIAGGETGTRLSEASFNGDVADTFRRLNEIATWFEKKAHWYEGMLDSIPFPISVTDTNMNWTFVNRPVEQMLSINRSDIIGKHCSNWGAAICKTNNCGITCLRNNKKTTFFEQMGMDFQVDTNYLYDASNQVIGHIEVVQDISKLVEHQKAQEELVKGIVDTSSTFAAASRSIAESSQSLAMGATEQAETISNLSASLEDVAEKTRTNSTMAGKAVQLAGTIKKNAEKGSEQMTNMIQAVNEINEASQSINKVIKVIEDIAFQTNLLALNAAVEAARAGQYGKGFAVVAEEVRNLATKSGVAAKDTSALIINSLEKAEIGARIAGDTAAGFAEIVSGINESNQIVNQIAQSSEKQSADIAEIHTEINRAEQLVHETSATAQQSAAASEELSAQSNVLENLLDQFNTSA